MQFDENDDIVRLRLMHGQRKMLDLFYSKKKGRAFTNELPLNSRSMIGRRKTNYHP